MSDNELRAALAALIAAWRRDAELVASFPPAAQTPAHKLLRENADEIEALIKGKQ